MAAIVVNTGHTEFAKRLLTESNIWIAIGRTTDWADNDNPPEPDPTANTVEEIIGFKKIGTKALVTPDPTGSINFAGTNYKIVDSANYKTDTPNLLYLRFEIVGDELPLISFRQIGMFYELVPAAGYESADVLLPDQVSDPGFLVTLDNRSKIDRYADSKNVIEFLIRV